MITYRDKVVDVIRAVSPALYVSILVAVLLFFLARLFLGERKVVRLLGQKKAEYLLKAVTYLTNVEPRA